MATKGKERVSRDKLGFDNKQLRPCIAQNYVTFTVEGLREMPLLGVVWLFGMRAG